MAHYRVLIVDDNRDIRHLFAEALRALSKDMDILEMPSAEEALFVTAGTHVDLLISDVYLPGISGLDMVKRLRKSNPTLKIILVTGASDPKVKDEVAGAGAAAFFYKPINIQELMDTVQRFRQEMPAEEAPPPQPAESQAAAAEKVQLTMEVESRLAELLDELKAQAAALLSGEGVIVAQAGNFSAFIGVDVLSRINAAFQAGLMVSRSMNVDNPENLMSFSGKDYCLSLAPVGSSFYLAVIGSQALHDSLLSPGRRLMSCTTDLLKALEAPKAPLEEPEVSSELGSSAAEVQPEMPVAEELPAAEVSPEEIAAVDALFSQSGEKPLHPKDVDAFWDSVAEQSEADGSEGQSIISYEEAQKRGLTIE